jgi:aldehyde:ferredoxin oxidoreductase
MGSEKYTKLYGYTGRLLRIDLSDGEVSIEEIEAEVLSKFLSGVGYGTRLLYNEISVDIDPLSPQGKLLLTVKNLIV